MTPSKIQPLELGNLSSRVYRALREALIAGNFRPGQRLVMHELAETFGTSVTPVREACLRLVSERGLELRSGRFAMVPRLTLSRYIEIRTIRIALEGLAAELACAHVNQADLDRLAQTQTQFENAERAGKVDAATRANRDFHFAVYRLSRLDMLTEQIECLWVSMGPILSVYYNDIVSDYVGADEHYRVIEALGRRHQRDARAAIERDILRGGQCIVDYLTGRQEAKQA